jgi:hypothetical protein
MRKIPKHPCDHTEIAAEGDLVGANHCYRETVMIDELVYGTDEIHCIGTVGSDGRLRHLYDRH